LYRHLAGIGAVRQRLVALPGGELPSAGDDRLCLDIAGDITHDTVRERDRLGEVRLTAGLLVDAARIVQSPSE